MGYSTLWFWSLLWLSLLVKITVGQVIDDSYLTTGQVINDNFDTRTISPSFMVGGQLFSNLHVSRSGAVLLSTSPINEDIYPSDIVRSVDYPMIAPFVTTNAKTNGFMYFESGTYLCFNVSTDPTFKCTNAFRVTWTQQGVASFTVAIRYQLAVAYYVADTLTGQDDYETYSQFNFDSSFNGIDTGIKGKTGFLLGSSLAAYTFQNTRLTGAGYLITPDKLTKYGNADLLGRYVFSIADKPTPTTSLCANSGILTLLPNLGSALGGRPLIIDGPCLNPRSNPKCVFNGREETPLKIEGNRLTCLSPMVPQLGGISLSINVTENTEHEAIFGIVNPWIDESNYVDVDKTDYTATWTNPQSTIVFISLVTFLGDNSTVQSPLGTKVEVALSGTEGEGNDFEIDIIQRILILSEQQRVQVTQMPDYGFICVYSTTASEFSFSAPFRLVEIKKQAFLSLPEKTAQQWEMTLEAYASGKCQEFLDNPPSAGTMPPAPCTLDQARNDPWFFQIPDTNCFESKARTVGLQVACYSPSGPIICGEGRGKKKYRHPDGYIDKDGKVLSTWQVSSIQIDELMEFYCCGDFRASREQCGKYTQIIKSDGCEGYVPLMRYAFITGFGAVGTFDKKGFTVSCQGPKEIYSTDQLKIYGHLRPFLKESVYLSCARCRGVYLSELYIKYGDALDLTFKDDSFTRNNLELKIDGNIFIFPKERNVYLSLSDYTFRTHYFEQTEVENEGASWTVLILFGNGSVIEVQMYESQPNMLSLKLYGRDTDPVPNESGLFVYTGQGVPSLMSGSVSYICTGETTAMTFESLKCADSCAYYVPGEAIQRNSGDDGVDLTTFFDIFIPGEDGNYMTSCGCPSRAAGSQITVDSPFNGSEATWSCDEGFDSATPFSPSQCINGAWSQVVIPECVFIDSSTDLPPACGLTCDRGECMLPPPAFTAVCDCDEGYTGALCDTAIPNACASYGPCLNGECQEQDGKATCQCQTGYVGKFCDRADPCDVCYDDGTESCTQRQGICKCKAGWRGETCRDAPMMCSTDDCLNNGTCYLDANRTPKCWCTEVYAGDTCEEYLGNCPEAFCNYQGECYFNTEDERRCKCPVEWGGERCDDNLAVCPDDYCENEGVCSFYPQEDGSLYSCDCPPGYTGFFCDTIDGCEYMTCQNEGVCENDDGTSWCICPPGFGGQLCDTFESNCEEDENECEAGLCYMGEEGLICYCPLGLTGTKCELDLDECKDRTIDVCNGNGKCVNSWGSFTCYCDFGYAGYTCNTPLNICGSTPCYNNGVCFPDFISEDRRFTCTCPLAWSGELCEVDVNECEESDPVRCKNEGKCFNTPGKYYCDCPIKFFGPNCEYNFLQCSPDVCENGGTCVEMYTDFFCVCREGYSGARCEITIDWCAQMACENGGVCTNTDIKGICECSEGYTGDFCEEQGEVQQIIRITILAGLSLCILLCLGLLACCCRAHLRRKAERRELDDCQSDIDSLKGSITTQHAYGSQVAVGICNDVPWNYNKSLITHHVNRYNSQMGTMFTIK